MSRRDRVIGIVLGLVIGIATVIAFVFLLSEQTIDAPSLDEGPPPARERPEPEGGAP